MRQSLKKTVLLEVSRQAPCTIVDFDMAACHSRVAASLLGRQSMLSQTLIDPTFWDTQTSLNIGKVNNLISGFSKNA